MLGAASHPKTSHCRRAGKAEGVALFSLSEHIIISLEAFVNGFLKTIS